MGAQSKHTLLDKLSWEGGGDELTGVVPGGHTASRGGGATQERGRGCVGQLPRMMSMRKGVGDMSYQKRPKGDWEANLEGSPLGGARTAGAGAEPCRVGGTT